MIYQLLASITGGKESTLGLRFSKCGLLPLIKGCFVNRLGGGPSGLADSMCTNAAFALANLASGHNPLVMSDIKHAQML